MKQDKDYIKRVLRGEINAFSCLIDRHKGMVYTIALRVLKNSEDAEELAQDTFIKAFNSLKQFKFESKFSTWLYTITYNGAISKLRKKQIKVFDVEEVELSSNAVVSSYNAVCELTKSEQKKYINEAIEKLKDDDACIITLYYLQENSVEEICKITGLTSSNVKVKLHRSRKRFYDELKTILKDEVNAIL